MANKKILTDLTVEGDVQADSFVKDNGLSSQFLKADGSVDSSTYATSASIPTNTSFVDLTTHQNVNGNKTFNDDIFIDTLNVGGTAEFQDDATFESVVGLYEGNKIIFDYDSDSFGNIFVDTADNNNLIHNSPNQHHFKNGDDGSWAIVEAGEFVRDGGTSAQFLKADGSVDSSTYLTDSSTQSKYLRSDTNDTTTGTLTGQKFYVSTAKAASEWAFQGRNNNSTADSGLYFNSNNAEFYLRNSSNSIGTLIKSSGSSYFNGGNVGIGTTSPDVKLEVISGSNNGIRVKQSDSSNSWNRIGMLSYVTQAQADALEDSSYFFTANPSGQTETAFSKYGGTVIQGRDDGNSSFAIRLGNGSGHATRMFMGATGGTTFSNTVTATNFILSSDSRLKENVEEVDNKTIDVDWKTFEMKEEAGQKRYGVIAQELEETHPEFVRTDDEGMKSVAYVDLLIAKIAELEARLEKAGI